VALSKMIELNKLLTLVIAILFSYFSQLDRVLADVPFWIMSNGKSSVAIIGVSHFSKKYPTEWINKSVWEFCDGHCIAWFETDVTDSSNLSEAHNYFVTSNLNSDFDIRKYLKKDEYEEILSYLDKMNLTDDSKINNKEYMWSTFLRLLSLNKRNKNSYYTDFYLINQFKGYYWSINSLESSKDQIVSFTKISNRYQSYMLRDLIIKSKEYEESKWTDRLENCWFNGDQNCTYDIMNESILFKENEIRKRIFEERNKIWARKLSTTKEKNIVIVGLGHTLGKKSLIYYLKKNGFYNISDIK
jgi:uncharacterized protein YbaP (TraB family)